MMIIILAFSLLVQGIYLKENIGDLYITQEEVYELKLSDYFSGNNLTYQITETDAKNDEIALKGGADFKMLSFLPFKDQLDNESFLFSQQFYKSWLREHSLIICNFFQNYIYFYEIPNDKNNPTLIFEKKIQTQFLNPTIENVQKIQFQNDLIFLIYIKQQENIDNEFIWRNDFYLLNITNDFDEPINLELNLLTDASKVVMSNGEETQRVPIYAEFVDKNIQNTIYLYDFVDPYKPFNFINITNNAALASTEQLSVKAILHGTAMIYVLDKNIGLLIYFYTFFHNIRENYFSSLKSYGDLLSMWFIYGIYNSEYINIQTSLGNIWLHFGGEVRKWIPNREINNIELDSLYSQKYDEYCLVSYTCGTSSILSFIDLKSPQETLIDISIENIIGNSYNSRGPWMILWNRINREIYYIRSDFDGLRLFTINFELFKLKLKGNSNFDALITATENDSSISSSLKIFSIPLGSANIFPINNYRSVIANPISVFFGEPTINILVSLSSYFSGPNLSFIIKNSFSELFSYTSRYPQKIEMFSKQLLPKEILFVEDTYLSIIYYFKDHIELWNKKFSNINNPMNVLHTSAQAWIYWKTQNSVPMISSYDIFNESMIEAWESNTECSIFKNELSFLIFMCSDREKIDIYLAVNNSQKLISLAGENFEEGFQWNLIDIFSYSISYFECFLYLIDKNHGLLVIKYQFDEIPNTYLFRDETVKDAHSILQSKNLLYIISKNGTTTVFDYSLNHIKTLQNENYGTVLRTNLAINYLYIQYEEVLLIYDVEEPAHNALFLEMKLEKNGYISTIGNSKNYMLSDSLNFMIFYPYSEEKYYEMYQIATPQERMAELSISANYPEKLINQVYQETISVIAYNEFSTSSVDLQINLIVNGAFIWYDENSQISIKNDISYDDAYEVDLSGTFHGQGMEMALNINGKYINNQDGIIVPAYVNERSKIIGRYDSLEPLFHYTIIPGTDIQVITSDSFLILTKVFENNSKGISLNLSEIFHADELRCKLIDNFEYTKNSSALIVTSCTQKTMHYGLFILKHLLILWELDYNSFSIKSYKSLTLGNTPSNLKILTLDNTNFEIMVSEFFRGLGNQKKILRFKGSWLPGDIKFQEIEQISTASLNLQNFNTNIFDGKVKNLNTTYWYIVDIAYGLRILEITDNNTILIAGLPIKKTDTHSSIGICGNYLYIATDSIKKYFIKNYYELTFIEDYYYNDLINTLNSKITCSEDGRYLALHIFRYGSVISARIFDTLASSSSSIIMDIDVTNDIPYTETYEVKFMDLNTFFVIQKHRFSAIKINPLVLNIPKLSESEYIEMIKEWGTNEFDVVITAKNKESQASSSAINFKRTPRKNLDKSN